MKRVYRSGNGIRICGVTLLSRTSDERTLNIIYYHPASSATWLWGLSVHRDAHWRFWPVIGRSTHNYGGEAFLKLPFGGILFRWAWQTYTPKGYGA